MSVVLCRLSDALLLLAGTKRASLQHRKRWWLASPPECATIPINCYLLQRGDGVFGHVTVRLDIKSCGLSLRSQTIASCAA